MNWVHDINKAHGIVKNVQNMIIDGDGDDDDDIIAAANIYGLNTSQAYFLNRLTPMTQVLLVSKF